jgi:hypothetical protein
MPDNSDIAVDDSNIVIKRELHTKFVTPRRLSQELKDLLGDNFKVEVNSQAFCRDAKKRQLTLFLDAP